VSAPLQLSLFDAPDAAAVAAAAAPALVPVPAVPHASVSGVAPPAAVPAPVPAGVAVAFTHPRANREVRLAQCLVGYEFRRARRRTIGFVVGPEGLTVSAPRWVPRAEVDAALQEKARWILRRLHEARERAHRLGAARVDWRDGTTLPYLGEPLVVVVDPRAGAAAGGVLLRDGAEPALPGVAQRTLHVGLAHPAQPAQLRDAVQSWLKREALRVFEARCAHFVPRLGVRLTRLALSSAATRWGSASADGAIRLNWRLIHFALPVIDYVLVHELAHLRHMDHSPHFWDVVGSVVPDYRDAREQLRDPVLPVFD
jgi:predicted metal-dependent hydrolase